MNTNNTKFSANYTITNAKLLGIKADIPSLSTIVSMQTNGNGTLLITIPRELADDRHSHKPDQIIVLDNGQEIDYQLIKTTSTNVTMSIPFTDGTEEIEIIATNVG
ncbi:MAG: hypothetical protein ACREAD_07215 [Nitrosopumilaceae archaeon]